MIPRSALRSVIHTAHTELHDQKKRKISHLANTSQRIRFKQVEVRPKGAPPESLPRPSTRGKGKGATSKQKASHVDDVDILDLITGNMELGDVPSQSRGRRGKGRGIRADGDQTSQAQPGDVEQVAISEDTPSALEAPMEL